MFDLERLGKIEQIRQIVQGNAGRNPFAPQTLEEEEEERRRRAEEEAALQAQGWALFGAYGDWARPPAPPDPAVTGIPAPGQPGAALPTPEDDPLKMGGYGQPARPQGFWESVWTGISNTLTIFDPLLLTGDASKAFIYGLSEGGYQRGFELMGKQLSHWQSYLPGGQRVKQIVSGEELAQRFIPNYEQMAPWQRFGYSLTMDLATDPLTVFGIAGMALKAMGMTARVVARIPVIRNIPGAGVARAAGEALERAAPQLERVDALAQRTLNPFSLAAQGVGLAARLPAPFAGAGQTVGESFGALLDKALSIKIRDVNVMTAAGVQHKTKLTLGNFFFPFGDTLQQQRDIFSKMPHYVGGESTGAGALIRAKAHYQEYQQRVMSTIEDANRLIHDAFGQPVPIFRRKALPQNLIPFASELAETAGSIITKFGVVDSIPELQKASQAMRTLARSYNLDENLAESVFRQYHDTMRTAYLDTIYTYTGMPLYEQLYKTAARAKGLLPEEAWTRYMGYRAGQVVPEQVGGQWVYKNVDLPPFVTEISLPVNRKSAKDLADLIKGRLDPGKDLRTFMRLNSFHQIKALDEMPTLAAKINDYTLAAKAVAGQDIQAQILGDVGKVVAQIAAGPPADPKKFQQSIRAINQATNPYEFWDRVDNAVFDAGAGVGNLLASADKNQRGLGHAIVGSYMEAQGLIEEALVHYGMAAKTLKNREAARFIYAIGAPQIGITPQKRMKATLLTNRDLLAITRATEVNAATTQNIVDVLNKAAPGIFDEAIDAIEKSNSVYKDLVLGVARRDKNRLVDWTTGIITGTINATEDGVAAGASLIRRLGLEPELYQVMLTAGKTTNLEHFRTLFASNLRSVEREALEEYMRVKPNWMGAATAEDLIGEVKKGKWRGNPFSPVQWLADVKNGYARKIYAGNISPEATMGALMKGGLSLVPEIDPTAIATRVGEWMQRHNVTDPNLPAGANAVAQYLQNAGDRFAYSTNAIVKIMQEQGVTLNANDFNSLISYMLDTDITSATAIRNIGAKLTGGLIGVGRQQMLPGSFAKRVPGADWLVAYYDPTATLNELNRHASRNAMSYYVLEALHKDLQAAGMLFDDATVSTANIAANKLIKVPEKLVDMGDQAQTLAYGPLSGKWIPTAVWDDLTRSMSADPASRNETFASFLSFWRKALLNSHPTLLVNMIGNEYITWANMGPTFAMESWRNLGPAMKVYQQFLDKGTLPPNISHGAMHFLRETSLNKEIRDQLDQSIGFFLGGVDVSKYREGVLHQLITRLDKSLNEAGSVIAEKIGRPGNIFITSVMPIEAFSHVENIKRLANYMAGKKLGMNETEAMWAAANATFNYGQVPYGIQMIRNTGLLAFPSFAYFTIKGIANWAVKRPAVLTVPQRVSQASFSMLPDEEQARTHVYMEDWLRQSMPFVLPYKRPDGSYIAIPLSNIFPIRPASTELLQEAVTGGWLRPFVEATWGLLSYSQDPIPAGYPVFSARFGDVLYREAATPAEAVQGTLGYVARQFAPKYATRTFPIADAPALVSMHLGNPEAIGNVRSIMGRYYVQYTNPVAVAQFERMTGRAVGYTPEEAQVAWLAAPRPAPVNPFAPGANVNIRRIEREMNNIERAIRERITRGESVDELRERYQGLAQRAARLLQPYMDVANRYGAFDPLPPLPIEPPPGVP